MINKPTNCPDCGVMPGMKHHHGCDVEVCSVCGTQRIGCDCKGHDRAFARWTGFWPGECEAGYMGFIRSDGVTDLTKFYTEGCNKIMLVKPKKKS